MEEFRVLQYDPFQGDFGEPGDRTLQDKMVTTRKHAYCHSCGDDIAPKSRARSRVEVFGGELMRFKWCTACCEMMAIDDHDGLEDRASRKEVA